MNKSDLDASGISLSSLLTYSSWLVAGVWLIGTGVMLIFRPPNPDNGFFNYLLGAARLLIGVHALRTARSVARESRKQQRFWLQFVTGLLLTMMFVMPLLLFIFQILTMIFGTYQPDELYTENIARLVFVALCYIPAVVFADWRLRNQVKES